MFQRRIWLLWLVRTVRQFCGIASAGVQRSVFWCAWALRESPVPCRSRHPPGQVLQEGVPFFFLPLDLALDLGMIGRSSSMVDVLGIELFGKTAGDVAGPVIRQQSWSVPDMGLVTARRRQRHFQGSVALWPSSSCSAPGDYVSREVIQADTPILHLRHGNRRDGRGRWQSCIVALLVYQYPSPC